MKLLEKFVLALPIIGLVLKYQNPVYYKTSKKWDVYQLLITSMFFLYCFVKFIGYNINF
mgnify:CR=1 FL=1